jgi:hypothetical protein
MSIQVILLAIGCFLGGLFLGSAFTFGAMALCIVVGEEKNDVRD